MWEYPVFFPCLISLDLPPKHPSCVIYKQAKNTCEFPRIWKQNALQYPKEPKESDRKFSALVLNSDAAIWAWFQGTLQALSSSFPSPPPSKYLFTEAWNWFSGDGTFHFIIGNDFGCTVTLLGKAKYGFEVTIWKHADSFPKSRMKEPNQVLYNKSPIPRPGQQRREIGVGGEDLTWITEMVYRALSFLLSPSCSSKEHLQNDLSLVSQITRNTPYLPVYPTLAHTKLNSSTS